MPTIRVQLLGNPAIERDGKPLPPFKSRKVLALLAYLALCPDAHPRSRLAGLLWSDLPENKALNNLRFALWNLNQILGLPIVQADRTSVMLPSHASVTIDTDDFLKAIRQTENARQSGSPSAIAALERAVNTYRGDLLAGLDLDQALVFNEWLQEQRATLREMAVEAIYRLANGYLQQRRYPEALSATRRLLAMDPWREEAHRQMIKLLARSGQRSAALAQYETCRRILLAEFKVEPTQETQTLAERIRWADAVPRQNLPIQLTPFVGRASEMAEIANLLNDPDCRLLTLVGTGGDRQNTPRVAGCGRAWQ